jgi:hypothetical protein
VRAANLNGLLVVWAGGVLTLVGIVLAWPVTR